MAAKSRGARPDRLAPPEHVVDEVAEVWRELLERDAVAHDVDLVMLETYSSLIAQFRAIGQKLADEGIVVDGGERRGAVLHPALAGQRDLAEQIRKWAPLLSKPVPAVRRSGPLVNATKSSIKAVPGLDGEHFAAAVLYVETLAWLIDEAQRSGIEALQKATFGLFPLYLKACAEMEITPASLPPEAMKKGGEGGKVTKFQDAAQRRRLAAAS